MCDSNRLGLPGSDLIASTCFELTENPESPPPACRLGDADGLRAPKLKHPVQGLNGDGDLRRATPVRPRTQCISDHSFKPADS